MMKATPLILAVLLPVAACSPSLPPDFQEFIAETERRGMSEEAESKIRQIAMSITGTTEVRVTYGGSPGSFGVQHRSMYCPNPNADPKAVEKEQMARQERIANAVALIKPFADADESGFVSTPEAERFWEVMNAGMRAAFLTSEKGMDLETTAEAMMMSTQDLSAILDRYHEFLQAVPGLKSDAYPKVSFTSPSQQTHSSKATNA